MRKYEIMYIVDQDVNEADLKALNQKMDAILTNAGGKVLESSAWGLKDFAYEINHKKKGYYFVEILETTPENINEFRRVAKINKAIVREMVVNTETDTDYIQSVTLSKTDMTKFEEERREKRPFKRPDRRFDNNRYDDRKTEGSTRPGTRKPAAPKTEKTEKSDKNDDVK